MALLPIIQYPDPVLAAKPSPSPSSTTSSASLPPTWPKPCMRPRRRLAANQVGSLKRIVVIDITDEKNNLLVLVNPYIKSHTEELAEFEEAAFPSRDFMKR